MLGGRDDLVASFRPFAQSLASIRNIEVNDKVESGTEHAAVFYWRGCRAFAWIKIRPDYKYTHHSSADALEAVEAGCAGAKTLL